MRRDREPLQLHSLNQVGAAPILGTLRKRLLLRTKESRRVRPIRLVEIAGPQIVGLHHVKVAVHDQIALARHVSPLGCHVKLIDAGRARFLPRRNGSQIDDTHFLALPPSLGVRQGYTPKVKRLPAFQSMSWSGISERILVIKARPVQCIGITTSGMSAFNSATVCST